MLRTVVFRLLKPQYHPIIFISIAIHIFLVFLTRNDSLILDVLMYWTGIALIVYFKVNHFRDGYKRVHSHPLIKMSTILAMGLLLLAGIAWGQQEQFLRLCPVIMFGAFCINYANAQNAIRLVCLMFFSMLIIPTRSSLEVLGILIEPTAKFVAYLMSIFGVSLKQDGALLTIGHHLVEISPACASVGTMRRIVSIGIWIALFKPRYRFGILWIPIVFSCYAFVSNGIRLAGLVYLKAAGNDKLFTFWHDGGGKSFLPLLILSPLLLFFRRSSQPRSQDLV
jgi:exosortase/archaeosortase family protein